MGGVEFAESAAPLWTPVPLGGASSVAALAGPLAAIDANGSGGSDTGGATNYEAGFTVANTANPTAAARIFFSDGAPNEPDSTPDPTVWRNPTPTKTYVVGFSGAASVPGVLSQIAADTGGVVFQPTSSANLLQTGADLTAALNCRTAPQRFTDTFQRQGQVKGHSFKAQGKTAEILTTWESPTLVFSPSVPRGGTTATVAKVKTKTVAGTTFRSLTLRGLKKGKKVKFKVKAKKVFGPSTAITQVIK